MAYAQYGPHLAAKAAADFTSTPYRAVALDGNGELVLAGAGELAVGILIDDRDGTSTDSNNGEYATYQYRDVAKWSAGAAISAGDLVMADANGQAITATATNYAIGRALEAATAANEIIAVQLGPIYIPA